MYTRGSIYSTPNRKWRVESECSQGIWKAKSQVIQDYMRKTPKPFSYMHISRCMQVLAQKSCIHRSIALKVVYTHKHVFFGNFLWTSKYNMRKQVQGVCRGTWKAIKIWSTKGGKISYNIFLGILFITNFYSWTSYLPMCPVIADFTTLGRSHLYGLPCPSANSLDPPFSIYTLINQESP